MMSLIRTYDAEDHYTASLKKCRDLNQGRRIHARILEAGLWRDRYLCNLVVEMYGKCGNVIEARKAFDSIALPNVFSWNIIISAYAQNGHLLEARQMFDSMPDKNVVAWNAMITAYARNGLVTEAAQIFEKTPQPNIVSWNSILAAYAHNGCLEDAQSLFDRMPNRNLISWNTILAAHAGSGDPDQAQRIFDSIPDPDVISWTTLLSAYAQNGNLELAQRVFDSMPMKNVVSWTIMVAGFSEKGDTKRAREIFDRAPNKNIICWNAMVTAYARNGDLDQARALFDAMVDRNSATWTTMVVAYADHGDLHQAKNLFERMPNKDVVSWTAMVTAHSSNGSLREAKGLFDKMPERNVVSWNAMLAAYARNGRLDEARELFDRMPRRSSASWNAMIAGYVENGCLMEEARGLFEAMPDSVRSVVSWNTLIGGFARAGRGEEAWEIFLRMDLEGRVRPNEITFASVVDACASSAARSFGKLVHEEIRRSEYADDIVVCNALINMYGVCGCIVLARLLFEEAKNRNVVTWNALLAANAHCGLPLQTLELWKRMCNEGWEPDEVTFIIILAVCSHNGLFRTGFLHFKSIAEDHFTAPTSDHFLCLVDLFGRAGWLNCVEELLKYMPFEPNIVAWVSLLGACKVHNDLPRAKRVYEDFQLAKKLAPGPYVLLSNMYAQSNTPADRIHRQFHSSTNRYSLQDLQELDLKAMIDFPGWR